MVLWEANCNNTDVHIFIMHTDIIMPCSEEQNKKVIRVIYLSIKDINNLPIVVTTTQTLPRNVPVSEVLKAHESKGSGRCSLSHHYRCPQRRTPHFLIRSQTRKSLPPHRRPQGERQARLSHPQLLPPQPSQPSDRR